MAGSGHETVGIFCIADADREPSSSSGHSMEPKRFSPATDMTINAMNAGAKLAHVAAE